jgi:hypothetical protein
VYITGVKNEMMFSSVVDLRFGVGVKSGGGYWGNWNCDGKTRKRPSAVELVAILTLLRSGALFMLFMVSNFLLVVGGEGYSGGIDWLYLMQDYPVARAFNWHV